MALGDTFRKATVKTTAQVDTFKKALANTLALSDTKRKLAANITAVADARRKVLGHRFPGTGHLKGRNFQTVKACP